MKRYFFHIGGDQTEIRDLEGVLLPEGADVADFCRKLILEVASEDEWSGEFSDDQRVTVVDDAGRKVLIVPLRHAAGDATPQPLGGSDAFNLH